MVTFKSRSLKARAISTRLLLFPVVFAEKEVDDDVDEEDDVAMVVVVVLLVPPPMKLLVKLLRHVI